MVLFDLPQLYTKPPFSELLSALELVAVAPASWDGATGSNSGNESLEAGCFDARKVCEEGVPNYLTGIIKSPLAWLSSPSERERVWETASRRLSERAGRSAQPPLTRSFGIPGKSHAGNAITIRLHEPTLTSDNLGLKTWASSYLLAKRLSCLSLPSREHVLELGAGTGLVGIAAAALWGARVHLTDLPAIVANLRGNVAGNAEVIGRGGGVATVGVLDWEDAGPAEVGDGDDDEGKYPVILVADPIYSPAHPRLLVQTIVRCLEKGVGSRVVIELPLREAYEPEIGELRERMEGVGFRILEEGEESGFDDWGGGVEGELREVKCWWGIWG
ncbi:MAG: hypothetical protein M1840_007552 [Geoglossum simile]|nr:MAG: hypothetical protein M1840_007552 [Geoglossum simile]